MAFGNRENSYKLNGQNAEKADVILEVNSQMSAKIDSLIAKVNKNNAELERALSKLGKGGRGADSSQLEKVYSALHEEYNSIRREITYVATQNEHIFLELSSQIQKLTEAISGGAPVASDRRVSAQIDYNELAAKIVELLPAQEYISPDYIASKVAEQLAFSDFVPPTHTEPVKPYHVPAAVPVPVDLQHSDEIADRIALRLGAMKADDFDIVVDDYGCSAISDSISEKLNYDLIAAAITEKLHSALSYLVDKDPDYDEIASRISQKIAASVTSPAQLPEIDADDIADKVVNQLLDNMPSVTVDSEEICKNISEKLVEAQENNDYDIVIDEEGLNKITDYVAAEIRKSTESRLDGIERSISELKAIIAGGAVVQAVAAKLEEASAEAEVPHDELEDKQDGVDFENMMKYDRSFIARIIQSSDEQKEYYGRVKTALLSYSRVNSNVAWGSERFNKGRETVARLKIRGKTLCLYLALNPQDFEYSVYHHADVSDNKSMRGTPMMIKVKSPRGVKKAIRLIDDMLAQRNAVKRAKFTERDYSAMYPYESIEELIEDGLVKDVSKNK